MKGYLLGVLILFTIVNILKVDANLAFFPTSGSPIASAGTTAFTGTYLGVPFTQVAYTRNGNVRVTDGATLNNLIRLYPQSTGGNIYVATSAGPEPTFDTLFTQNFPITTPFITQSKLVYTLDHVLNNGVQTGTVTAQLSIFVDSTGVTFACFNFAEDGLEWSTNNVGFELLVGNFRLPYTSDTRVLSNQVGNLGYDGLYCYRIDQSTIVEPCNDAQCETETVNFRIKNNAGNTRTLSTNVVNKGSSVCSQTTPTVSKSTFVCDDVGHLQDITLTAGATSCVAQVMPTALIRITRDCPEDIVSETCTGIVNWIAPIFVGDCTPVNVESTAEPGSVFTAGVHTITYTATDTTYAENSASCSFTITVTGAREPILGPHQDVTSTVTTGDCFVKVDWTPPVIQHVCSVYTLSSTSQPGITLFPVHSETLVTYTINDSDGYTDVSSFNVIVEDAFDPVPTCSGPFSGKADLNSCSTTITIPEPTVVECDGYTSLNSIPSSVFIVGEYTGKWTTTDDSGNKGECTYTVSVIDDQKPTIGGCTNGKGSFTPIIAVDSVNCVEGSPCLTTITYTVPTPYDNCDGVGSYDVGIELTSGPDVNSLQPFGKHTSSFKATDTQNNFDTCDFEIEVIGIQVLKPTAPILQNQPFQFDFNYYLPGETKVVVKILNQFNRAIKSAIITIDPSQSSGSFTHTFSATSAPGTYSITISTPVINGVNIVSVATPHFQVCPPGGCP